MFKPFLKQLDLKTRPMTNNENTPFLEMFQNQHSVFLTRQQEKDLIITMLIKIVKIFINVSIISLVAYLVVTKSSPYIWIGITAYIPLISVDAVFIFAVLFRLLRESGRIRRKDIAGIGGMSIIFLCFAILLGIPAAFFLTLTLFHLSTTAVLTIFTASYFLIVTITCCRQALPIMLAGRFPSWNFGSNAQLQEARLD